MCDQRWETPSKQTTVLKHLHKMESVHCWSCRVSPVTFYLHIIKWASLAHNSSNKVDVLPVCRLRSYSLTFGRCHTFPRWHCLVSFCITVVGTVLETVRSWWYQLVAHSWPHIMPSSAHTHCAEECCSQSTLSGVLSEGHPKRAWRFHSRIHISVWFLGVLIFVFFFLLSFPPRPHLVPLLRCMSNVLWQPCLIHLTGPISLRLNASCSREL